jgi:hypothetical protein
MIHQKILEDLMEDSPCVKLGICDEKEGHWCMLRELVRIMGMEDRNAEQLKLMYDYKYMVSKREGKDIGRERAFNEFISQYGAKFAEVYHDDMTNGELFKAVFGVEKQHTDEDITAHILSK